MKAKWDVIIVGARIAGSTVAAYLGRAGLRVLLVERALLPADHPQQGSWGLDTNIRWSELGVLPHIEAIGAPRRSGHYFVTGDVVVPYAYPDNDRLNYGMNVRRKNLDFALATYAASFPSVELRLGFTAKELLWDDGRAVGIRGTAGGESVEERSSLVIGADGRNSWLARQVDVETYEQFLAPKAFYIADFSNTNVQPQLASFIWNGPAIMFLVAVEDGLATSGVSVLQEELADFRTNLPESFHEKLRSHPHMREMLGDGVRETKVMGAVGLSMYKRVPHGAGWALLGDAGYHLDPNGGRGTTAAVASAELMSRAVLSWLGGEATEEEAFARYQQERDEVLQNEWDFTRGILDMGSPTEKDLAEARVLAANPELRNLEMRVQYKLSPPEEYEMALREHMERA